MILTPVSIPACWMQSRDAAHVWRNEFYTAINSWGYVCWCCRDMCVSHHISTAILCRTCL